MRIIDNGLSTLLVLPQAWAATGTKGFCLVFAKGTIDTSDCAPHHTVLFSSP